MIEPTLFNVVGVSILAVMIAFWYQPIQKPKRYLLGLFSSTFISSYLDKILNCGKCSAFTLGILLFWSLPAAGLCALFGFLITFVINYIEVWYE